jgi:tRNA-dihydrouridine synthase B
MVEKKNSKKLKNFSPKSPFLLAPMANYTNVAFRVLCTQLGAGMVYTELISVKAIGYKNKKTDKLLDSCDEEKPIYCQLFGNEPKDFGNAISIIEKRFPERFEGYDLNAGCSVPKAKKGKYGSALMESPENIGKIIAEMNSKTEKPITIKMRLGFKKENFLDCALQAQDNGAVAICLHTRLGVDEFSVKARPEKIAELKKLVKIPVIGNGDITTAEQSLEIMKKTKCDSIMLGRAALNNPQIFGQSLALFEDKKFNLKSTNEIALDFLNLAQKFNLMPNDARPCVLSMIKNFEGSAKLRNEVALTKTISEMIDLIKKTEIKF